MLYITAELVMHHAQDILDKRSIAQVRRHHRQAMREPMMITQRDKPRLVVLSIDDYEQLRKYADRRQAYTLETIPDDLFEDIVKAVEDYANEPDDDV